LYAPPAAGDPVSTDPAAPVAAPVGTVDVIEVSGRIDPVLADFTRSELARAEASHDVALVIQLDSPGSLLGRDDLARLATRLARARVPVAVWVGPSGAEVRGGALRLLQSAATFEVAPGAHGPRPGSSVSTAAPTLGEFLVGLDGQTLGGTVLHTARVVQQGRLLRREPAVQVRFNKLGLMPRLLHTMAGPSVAYVLLVIGLLLVIFEFFTVGVGVAGLVGAASLVLASYGLGVLPTRPLGLGLVVLGLGGMAIDVQAGAPRSWTVIGTVGLVIGSATLYGGGLGASLVTMVIVVGGVGLFMVAGMPAMLRARFSTPTIGRESMLGEMGQATTSVDPEGMVRVRGALWRARTNRATPVAAGLAIRVVAIDGLMLEVEPSEGGARDAGH